MSRRPKALADQFLDPPDFEERLKQYAEEHSLPDTIAFLDGAVTVFGIIEEMLFAKMKDGSRWTESRERAYFQISYFIRDKGGLLDKVVPEYEKIRESLNLPGRTPYTSIATKQPD